MAEKKEFREWAILELMGHRKFAGMVQEAQMCGAPFFRIDIPGEAGTVATQFYSPAAIYCITPVTEEFARSVAKNYQPEPVSRWELPAPKPEKPCEEVECGHYQRESE